MKIGETEFRSSVLHNCQSDSEHFKLPIVPALKSHNCVSDDRLPKAGDF